MKTSPLIRTKLAPPRLSAVRVVREGLLAEIESRRNTTVTLIVGPGGSGKTTLSALWRQRLISSGGHVAWYNIGSDDDQTQWAAYLIASLQLAGLDIGSAQEQALLREASESIERFSASLVNLIFVHPSSIHIFLEDLHLLRARSAFDVIERVLENPPPNMHLVLTSRAMPALDLSKQYRQAQVHEINFSQLQFSRSEQAKFLREFGVRELTVSQANRLYSLTEGWPIGVQLAGLVLRRELDFEVAFKRMTRLTVPLGDEGLNVCLEDSIESILEPVQLEVLIRLSACRRMNRSLAAAICEQPFAGNLLETLGAQSLFLMPIESEDVHPWYRFHRIFEKFLRQRLQRLPDEELLLLNRRASEWFQRNGLYVEAIRHARYAGDMPRQVELLSGVARELVRTGQFIQLLRLAEDVPASSVRENSTLLLCVGWAQVSLRRLREFSDTIGLMEEHPDRQLPEVDFELREQRALSEMVLDNPARVLELIEPFVDRPVGTDGFNLLMLGLTAATAFIGVGKYERARDVVSQYQSILRKKNGAKVRPYLDSIIGLSFLAQGDFLQARNQLERLMTDIEGSGSLAEHSAGHIAGYLAEAALQMNDAEASEEYFEIYNEHTDIVGVPDCTLFALRARARLYFMSGDLKRALETLDSLERVSLDEGWERFAAWSLAERVRMLGSRPNGIMEMREAQRRLSRLSQRCSPQTDGMLAEVHVAIAIARVDAAVAELDWGLVVRQASQQSETFWGHGLFYAAARMRVLSAIALHALGRSEDAVREFRPALTVGIRCGMRRLLTDEGSRGEGLTRALIQTGDLTIAEMDFLEPSSPPQTSAPTEMEVSELSPRELEILLLLGRALSGKTIARSLNISLGTVKWHVKNIYRKLDAVSREDAVSKAREKCLI